MSLQSGEARVITVQVSVEAPLMSTPKDLKPLFDLAFTAIREGNKDLTGIDDLRVVLILGYDIGIRRRKISLAQDETPLHPGVRIDEESVDLERFGG